MRQLTLIILLCLQLLCSGQVTIYSENCGSSPTFTSVSTYTGWQRPGNYSGNASVRNTLPSTGYAGASGGANVFFTNVVGTNLELCCVDTKCYLYAFLSVGIYKSTTASNGSELVIEYSEDGITWIQMPFTLPTGSGSAIWRNLTLADYLPLTDSLRLRFRQTSSTGVQFRVDDINVAGIQNIQDSLISNCSGFFYDNAFYSQEGTYDFVIQDSRGCDSILRIEYVYDPSDPTCLLPIELTEFYGIQKKSTVELYWTVLNNDEDIVLEKSKDALSWDTIYTVTSRFLTRKDFSFVDYFPYIYNYYKIDNTIIRVVVDIKQEQYYNLLGQPVDITTAPRGMYISKNSKLVK